MHSVEVSALCIALVAVSSGQSLDPSSCIGTLTAAPNCDFYNSKLSACNSLRGSAAASCYCPQTVFDALVRCEGEFRECLASDYFDPQFEAPSSGLFALWHSACDATITYTVTTPVAAEPSITVGADYCNSVDNDCNRWGALTDSCTTSFTVTSDFLSCWCQSSILSLASRCEIDGSSTCLLESVVTSNLWSYKYCGKGISAGAQPVTGATATIVASTTVVGTSQVGTTPAGTAAPSTLPSVPALSTTSPTGVSSLLARLVTPFLRNAMLAAFYSTAIISRMN